MRIVLLLIMVSLLIIPFATAELDCNEFCQDEEYTYGICREDTSQGGECDLYEQDVENLECGNSEKCCCVTIEGATTEEEEEDPVEEIVEEDNNTEIAEEEVVPKERKQLVNLNLDLGDKSVPESLFWFLLVIVIILGVANIIIPKKKKGSEFDNEIEELI